jgi:hypothetical protein
MPAVIDLLLLILVLTGIYAALGVVSLAFEQVPVLLRRPRRSPARTLHHVRRRAPRPRRQRSATPLPPADHGRAAAWVVRR